jgi:hypothetical protein
MRTTLQSVWGDRLTREHRLNASIVCTMKSNRSLAALAVAAVCGIGFTACGGSESTSDVSSPQTTLGVVDSEPDDFTEPATTVEAEPVATEPAVTEPAATEPTATEPVASVVDTGVAGGPIVATLTEWAIEAPTEYAAGDVTFSATNAGSFPHELAVIEGASYESLPLEEGGAVIEAELPTGALIGRTAKIAGGAAEDLTVTLAPGSYVLICNLGGGATSHAGQGQRLAVTVS